MKKVQRFKPLPPNVAIWIAKHRDTGKVMGWLITRDKKLQSFVRGAGKRRFAVAHAASCNPDLQHGVDDLRFITLEGEHIDAPVFLFNLFFFAVNHQGQPAKMPFNGDCLSVSIVREGDRLRLWLEARTHVCDSMPGWLAKQLGAKKTASRPKLNPRLLYGSGGEGIRRKAA